MIFIAVKIKMADYPYLKETLFISEAGRYIHLIYINYIYI